ncbi:probable serine/threonine-protein kinase kinX [Parasteatoda tepidariorum]|uniref:probable serine/threonine-protein kinase kinX n=1 Tax=Parasteatoda tepidariorum TaxID=114398 RepID=UPI0039BC450E
MTSENNSRDKNSNDRNDEENEEENVSRDVSQLEDQSERETKPAEKTKPQTQTQQPHTAWFRAQNEKVRLKLGTNETECDGTSSEESDDYYETSEHTDPHSVGSELEKEKIEQEKNYEGSSEAAPAESLQPESAWFSAKTGKVRFKLPTNELKYGETTSDDTDDYVETSGLTEPYSFEPDPQIKETEHEKVSKETGKSGFSETFDDDESLQPYTAKFLAKAEKVRLNKPIDESKYNETTSEDTDDNIESSKLTEPSSAEPEPQREETKHEKVYEGTSEGGSTNTLDDVIKETPGFTEPYNVEPEPQIKKMEHEKVHTETGKSSSSETFDDDESLQPFTAKFLAKAEKIRLNIPIDESKYNETTSEDAEDYIESSKLTEPYSAEPEPQREEMKHEEVYEGTSEGGSTKIFDDDESLQLESTLYKHQTKEIEEKTDIPKIEQNIEVLFTPRKEDSEGLRGPTEPLSTDEPQKTIIKHPRVLTLKEGAELTESLNVVPSAQLEEAKRQMVYDIGVTHPEETPPLESKIGSETKILAVRPQIEDIEGLKGPTEPLATEPRPHETTIKHTRVFAGKEGVGLTEPSNVEPTVESEEAKRQKIYDFGVVHKEKTIEAEKERKYEQKISESSPKPKTKILVGRPRKEDLVGLRGPTEPIGTEPRPQETAIKHTRVFAGKEGVGLTEPPDVEPTVESEEAKRQKVYDVGVIYEEKEIEEGKDKLYDLTAAIGPTEDDDFEPEPPVRSIEQRRVYKVDTEDTGPTEPYSVEAQVQKIKLKGKPKLSDRMEYLARPKKDVLDCLGYKRLDGTVPENSLPSWSILPLSTKLPVGEYPYGMTMTPVNKELFLPPPSKDMDLYDEYNLQKPHYTYNSLYDPYLKSYFKRKTMREHLEKEGFVSESGKVICTLRDINDYRIYSRRVLAAEALQKYHDEDVEDKRKREKHYKKQRELQDEREKEKNVRTQVQMRTYLKNAVSTIREGSMSKQRERERKILNAQLRKKFHYAQRTANNKQRYERIYANHLEAKYDHDNKRKQLEKEMKETEKDKQEKYKIRQELKKIEKKKQNEEFWERKAAAQFEWLKAGHRLDSKFNKKLEANVQFRKEKRRSPSKLSLTDAQDIENKIYLLSKEEEEAEKELSAKEDQSHSEYKSRDILETNRLSIGESTDEVAEKENKSKSKSAEMSEEPNVEEDVNFPSDS